nr:type III secretion system stator protein SctL [uncultured Pseudomonas sp.]
MLTRRSLTLGGALPADAECLLRRETIEQCQAAQSIIDAAERQAAALLEQAQRHAEDLAREAREVASAEFWQQAEAFLDGWSEEQRQIGERTLELASRLVAQALTCLLDEVPEEARIHALLRQLRIAQAGGEGGELCCHPQLRPAVENWLEARRSCTWRIRDDETLDTGSLRLAAAHGDFVLSWGTAVAELLPRDF